MIVSLILFRRLIIKVMLSRQIIIIYLLSKAKSFTLFTATDWKSINAKTPQFWKNPNEIQG